MLGSFCSWALLDHVPQGFKDFTIFDALLLPSRRSQTTLERFNPNLETFDVLVGRHFLNSGGYPFAHSFAFGD